MNKVIKLSDQEREFVDRFFTKYPHLVRKYAGDDNQYLGDIWEAVGRAVKSYKSEKGDFVYYAAKAIKNAYYKALKRDKSILYIFVPKDNDKPEPELMDSSSDDDDDEPDPGGSAFAPTPSSPEDDVEYCEIVKIIEESLSPRDSQIICLLCSRLYDSGDC